LPRPASLGPPGWPRWRARRSPWCWTDTSPPAENANERSREEAEAVSETNAAGAETADVFRDYGLADAQDRPDRRRPEGPAGGVGRVHDAVRVGIGGTRADPRPEQVAAAFGIAKLIAYGSAPAPAVRNRGKIAPRRLTNVERQRYARLVRSRLLVILLLVAVTMAVGVCPCGRALILNRLSHVISPVAAAATTAVRSRCPACHLGDRQPQGQDHDAPDARRCSDTVSGDLPAAATHAPVLDAAPAVFQPLFVDPLPHGSAARNDQSLRAGLPPPPTLLSLSCSLTT
jgi:hypothetical protein